MDRQRVSLSKTFQAVVSSVVHLPYTMVFESNGSVNQESRYSYVCFSPESVLTSTKGSVVLTQSGIPVQCNGNPLEILGQYVDDTDDEFGWAGFLSYESGRFLTDYSFLEASTLPDFCFVLFKHIVKVDRLSQSIELWTSDLDEANALLSSKSKETQFTCEPSRDEINYADYIQMIERIKSYIASGDVYQINYTYPVTSSFKGDPYVLYAYLNALSPMPYSAFIRTPETCILSNSPELFIRQVATDIYTKPLKGTRPRGKDPENDIDCLNHLKQSKKDKAELLMIVDLERNDLNKICKTGSVSVSSLFEIEGFEYVYQQFAIVKGKLKVESFLSKLKALFPGGSITGAPKIRSMEIINEIEPFPRNVYTGCVGFVSKNQINLNIAIRTLYTENGSMVYHVGGGIVADSDPEEEWIETKVKGKAMESALSWFIKETMNG